MVTPNKFRIILTTAHQRGELLYNSLSQCAVGTLLQHLYIDSMNYPVLEDDIAEFRQRMEDGDYNWFHADQEHPWYEETIANISDLIKPYGLTIKNLKTLSEAFESHGTGLEATQEGIDGVCVEYETMYSITMQKAPIPPQDR